MTADSTVAFYLYLIDSFLLFVTDSQRYFRYGDICSFLAWKVAIRASPHRKDSTGNLNLLISKAVQYLDSPSHIISTLTSKPAVE